jgi:cytochrome c553
MDGVAKVKDVPNIAGQRPAYLYIELRVYQSGGRGNTPMNNVVKFLSDEALVNVAAFYASVNPAPPAPAQINKGAAAKLDPFAAGKAAAAGCSGCHGEAGVSSTAGTPSLAGLDPKYIADAVGAYKSGRRSNEMMKTMVSALSATDINNVALFFALQKPTKAKTPAPGDAAAGKTAAEACAGCHGEAGVSTGTAPSLAGQEAQYVIEALRAYKSGARAEEAMKGPAASVDDATAKNLAAYFAKQQPVAPNVRKPQTVDELAERCNRCHGVDGNSTNPRIPMLASQRAEYLERVMHAYQRGDRKSTAMTAMLDGLSDGDISGLAAHYARQKARAVIYMPLPAK